LCKALLNLKELALNKLYFIIIIIIIIFEVITVYQYQISQKDTILSMSMSFVEEMSFRSVSGLTDFA
jgi:hypothetical protein